MTMQCTDVLYDGGVIIYPTDTIWGIGCDARNVDAIEKIKQIKGRDGTKSFILLCRDTDMLKNYVVDIPPKALDILSKATSPTTIIYPNAKNLPINHLSQNSSIAIRIPKVFVEEDKPIYDYLNSIFLEFPYPIVSTSANYSGEKSPNCFNDIDKSLLDEVDYVCPSPTQSLNSKHSSKIFLISENRYIR